MHPARPAQQETVRLLRASGDRVLPLNVMAGLQQPAITQVHDSRAPAATVRGRDGPFGPPRTDPYVSSQRIRLASWGMTWDTRTLPSLIEARLRLTFLSADGWSEFPFVIRVPSGASAAGQGRRRLLLKAEGHSLRPFRCGRDSQFRRAGRPRRRRPTLGHGGSLRPPGRFVPCLIACRPSRGSRTGRIPNAGSDHRAEPNPPTLSIRTSPDEIGSRGVSRGCHKSVLH